MSRLARQMSGSGYYHVMLRGVNRQNIFEDDEDRQKYTDLIFRYSEETACKIAAWCLMSNHVHILIHSESIPDRLIKKIGCSYVPYFNRKYGRTGHLFQDRYKSELITDDRYLLGVVRYIHMNPEKAGFCRMEDWTWSSFRDYINGSGATETAPVLAMFSGTEDFLKFMHSGDDTEYLEDVHKLSEKEAVSIAKKVIPGDMFYLQSCGKEERNSIVRKLSEKGLTAAQICRITGLGKTVVYGLL